MLTTMQTVNMQTAKNMLVIFLFDAVNVYKIQSLCINLSK